MRRSFSPTPVAALLAGALLATGGGIGAEPAGQRLPCPSGSAEHAAAVQALAALDGRVRRLSDRSELQKAEQDLARLLASRCFGLSIDTWMGYQTSSTEAFQTWWSAGGHEWVGSYLEADAGGRLPQVVIPPDMIDSLIDGDRDGAPLLPALANLACRPLEAVCLAESRALRGRAERFFSERAADLIEPCPRSEQESQAPDPCAKAAQAGDYPKWRECVGDLAPRAPALPLGAWRSPRGGWLIVQKSDDTAGPGQGRPCARTRFFHVDSDSAYTVDRCPGREPAVTMVGRTPAGSVREALWMLLLADRVELRRPRAHRVRVPEGLLARWPAGQPEPGTSSCGMGAGSHAPRVSWRWQDRSRQLADGSFGVSSSRLGRLYASFLLDTLNERFSKAPPREALAPDLREIDLAVSP